MVKTRLQSSNSGFDTTLKIKRNVEINQGVTTSHNATVNNNNNKPNFNGKVSHVVYRPALGSQYTFSVQLLNANWSHFGSANPILYSTQSQPCRPLQSKLSAFGDRTNAKFVHTGHAVVHSRHATTSMGVWQCLK